MQLLKDAYASGPNLNLDTIQVSIMLAVGLTYVKDANSN
jgi:hypothetical protein